MFRLHIDIPLTHDEEESTDLSKQIAEEFKFFLSEKIKKVQYRLANDEDRTVRNYLIKDKEGHCSTKKCVVKNS